MSERATLRQLPGATALVAVVLSLLAGEVGHAATDATAARLGGLKGDEATYVAVAASLAYDGDLRFDAVDYARFRDWYGSGPEGIFLKQDAAGHLRFGKAFVHGVLAAPFVRAFGLTGLLLFNLACLVLVAVSGAIWLRRGSRPGPAIAFAVLFVAASVAPVYALLLTSDLLTFALVFCAFTLGTPRPGHSVATVCLAAALGLLALATFSKPIVLPLVVPLVLANSTWRSRRAVAAVAGYAVLVAVLFAANAWLTGEANYQGGHRKTFYGRFPFDEAGGTFETTGVELSTNTMLTPVGREGRATTVLPNLWYFVAGRHFGLVPFGWPWLVVVLAWAVRDRDKRLWQTALAASLAMVALATIVWMPYTWSGAGGPIGNRYFLSVAGAVFVLMPAVRSWWPVAAASVGLVFLAPTYQDPFLAARQPWVATRSPVFAVFPLELTGASDFPIVLDQVRGRIPQGRDPQLSVALLDEHAGRGRNGWISVGPAPAELLVRSPARLAATTVGVRTGRACTVHVSTSRGAVTVTLGDGDRRDAELALPQTFSRDSFVCVIRVDASSCPDGAEVAMQGRPAS